MTSNTKKKLKYSVSIFLMIILISVYAPAGQAAVSAGRTIENNVLTAGGSTNITVVINNDVVQALSLKEVVPPGWILTRVTDDADQFKASTNEWVWFTAAANAVKTVKYTLSVPDSTAPGMYDISGSASTSTSTVTIAKSTIEVKSSNVPPTQGTFGFIVTPISATINIGEIAKYNLTLTNTGSSTDTYNLVADKPNGTIVTLAKSNVTVGQGNSTVVGLTVSSSTEGTYTINVKATSKSNVNNSATVTTTTNVIIPVLTIDSFSSVPNSAISSTNPADISANVKKGMYNITKVELGIIDSNNLLGKGVNTILMFSRYFSGAQGLYGPEQWYGNYASIGNAAVSDIVTAYKASDVPGYVLVRGSFKANNATNGTEALLWFNMTTGKLSNVTKPYVKGFAALAIQNGNSTFQATVSQFVDGNTVQESPSGNALNLYDITGNSSANNPSIAQGTVPVGSYKVYAAVNDTNTSIYQLIDVNTIPVSTGNGNGGNSGGSSGGSSGDGTYPTVTATPKINATSAPTTTDTVRPTVTTTVTEVKPTMSRPAETIKETPSDIKKKGSPGIGLVVAIGIVGIVYLIRRRK